jgi:peptidoglycan-N-acetylglucosamine deacetylase
MIEGHIMARSYGILFIAILLLISSHTFAQTKEIAITIDDLPFVGTTHNKPGNLRREKERFMRIVDSLNKHQVTATGFVVAGTIEQDQWSLLEAFKDTGSVIANHTYTHLNLNTNNADRYISDIAKADKVLEPLMSGTKFFRYPYLAEGKGQKKEEVRNYLLENKYVIAPVTIDSKDFKFNARLLNVNWRSRQNHIPSIKRQYLNYMWRQTERAERKAGDKPIKQILLIHANYLNSYAMDDIIQMYKDKGYTFITLEEALEDNQAQVIEVSTKPKPEEEKEESSWF